MKKRIISLLLCMALLIGVMPMGLFTLTASAGTVPEIQNIEYYYDSLNNLRISFDGVAGAYKYEVEIRQTYPNSNSSWFKDKKTISTTEEKNKGRIDWSLSLHFFYTAGGGINDGLNYVYNITAYDNYGDIIAQTGEIIHAPFERYLDRVENIKLSKDGILSFDKVEDAAYYEVEMKHNSTRISLQKTEKTYVDFSEYVRDGDEYYFYIEACPKVYGRDLCTSYTSFTTVYDKNNTTLTGSVYIDNNCEPVFGGLLRYLDDSGDALSCSYRAFYNGGWRGIVPEDRYKYDPSMLRVVVYAVGYEGCIASADNRYTTPDNPYIATDYAGLKDFFDTERDITVETAYVKLGGNITYTAEEKEDFTLETHGCNVEIDLCGYTLDVLKKKAIDIIYRTSERLFWAKNGAITFKDSGKYDSSTGTIKPGKVNFGYKNYDKNDYVGAATMMEGEITVYGGEYKVSSHSAFLVNQHNVIHGSAVKVYGGKFTADIPVVLSYTDKEGYGIFGGTFETLNDACFSLDVNNIQAIKSCNLINSSGDKTASIIRIWCDTARHTPEYYLNELASQLPESTAIFADGVKVADITDKAKEDGDSTVKCVVFTPEFKEKAEIKQVLTIDNLDLTVTAPTYNAMPSSKITGGDNTLYGTTLVWDTYVDRKYKEVTEPFELGVEYRARVKITPRNGSEINFADGAVKINGKEASYNGIYYLARFTVNGTAITKETVPGSITVGKELGKVFSNSTNTTVAGTLWYHNGSIADPSETVTNGKYYATVYLNANGNYVFTKDSVVNIFGSDLKLSGISSDGKSAYVNTEMITLICDHKGDTSSIKSDDKNHWHVCTVCGMTYGKEAHTFGSGTTSGGKATKPADPTAEGWTFDGWYADATFSVAFDFNTAITADTTVYAKWTKNSVTPPVFEFTTQPQSGTAKKSEGYSFSWTISDTPDYYNLLVLWNDSWIGMGDTYLNGSTGTVPYVEAICTGNTNKYRIHAQKGAQTIYSDEFTVTWTDDTTPPVPTTPTVTFNMNGHGTQIPAQTVESGGKTTYTCTKCSFQKTVSSGKEEIYWVLINTQPLTVGSKLPEITAKNYDDEKLSLIGYAWLAGTNYATAVPVSGDAVVEAGKNYYLDIDLMPKSGCYVSGDPAVRLNGVTASEKTVQSGGSMLNAIISQTPVYAAEATVVVPELTVGKTMEKVLEEIGASAISQNFYGVEVEITENGVKNTYYKNIYTSGWKAYSDSTPYNTFITKTVLSGSTYSFKIHLPMSGTGYFVTEENVEVQNKFLADSVAVATTSTEVSATVIYTTEDDGTNISFIKLNADAPFAGNTPANTAQSGARYKVEKVEWSGTLKSGKFACGQTYTVKLTVSADDGYSFTDIAMATVNNNPATITKSGNKRIISYTFDKLTHDLSIVKYDKNNHWFECSAPNCTEKTSAEPHSTVNNSCTVCGYAESAFTLSGKVTSFGSASDKITISLYKTGQSTPAYTTQVTGNSANYTLSNVAAGTYTMTVSKTKHCTREYTITVNGNLTQNAEIRLYGDITGDGIIDSQDSMQINRKFNGKSSMFTNTSLSESDRAYLLKVGNIVILSNPTHTELDSSDSMQINRCFNGKTSMLSQIP